MATLPTTLTTMFSSRRGWTVVALGAPPAAAAAMIPVRERLGGADAALVLVLVIVAVAMFGTRLAGLLAALSCGVWFDFFLTRPYQRFTITSADDVLTMALLLLVGVGVTELAAWGRRQQAIAAREAGYLAGIQVAAEAVAAQTTAAQRIDQICAQLTLLLELRTCRFDYGSGVVGGDRPRLGPDGQVTWRSQVWDVDRDGLPSDDDIELLLDGDAGYRGRFLLRATPQSRPTPAQRLVAVALANRAVTTPAG
jgi:hypothetical protein